MKTMLEEKIIKDKIQKGRDFLKSECEFEDEIDYKTDQELKLPQPPLFKEPVSDVIIKLPINFDDLEEIDFKTIIGSRKSNRVYTQENVSLLKLSYLLYATQGVKEIRGKSYATIRTVPCGGARHEFDTYMVVQYVEGLKPGLYHYLPQNHSIEFLKDIDNIQETIDISLVGQSWAKKSSVVFYYSFNAYRAEWRYGMNAHRVVLIDIGHVGENLYLASTYLKLGTCGLGAYHQSYCDKLFDLDGNNEYIIYTQTLGTINKEDTYKEKDFYRFVEEQGL